MRKPRVTPSGVAVGAIVALVLGTGSAYAATGGTFILGRSNYASATTNLSNSTGPAMRFNSKSGTAPFTVNNVAKVPYLTADRLDGLDSTSFALAAGSTGVIKAEGAWEDVDDDTVPDTLFASATCPKGTKLVGGGAENWTLSKTLVSAPGDGETWWVVSAADPSTDATDDVVSYAVCYNPRGTVSGSTVQSLVPRKVPADLLARAKEAKAKLAKQG